MLADEQVLGKKSRTYALASASFSVVVRYKDKRTHQSRWQRPGRSSKRQ
jgi:hypothetical protein